jgi:hypothetical protein
MNLIKRLIAFLRGLFSRKEPIIDTFNIPTSPDDFPVHDTPRSKRKKHPLHATHFGTFTPVKPFKKGLRP